MRHEFPKSVKLAAFERSGGQCEAVGERYGLPAGVRCQQVVAKGHMQFDHYPRGAHDPHPDTRSLGNCLTCCPTCNQYANNKFDTPREAKMKDVRYKHATHDARMARKAGVDAPDPPRPRPRKNNPKPIMSQGFRRGQKTKIPSRPFMKTRHPK